MTLKSGPVVRAPGGIFSPSTLTRSLTPYSAWEWETVLLPTVLNELLVFSTTQAHISSGRQGWKPVNYISQNPVNYISQNPLSAGIPFIFHNDTLIWDLEERGETLTTCFLRPWWAVTLVWADVGFCSHLWFFPCESPACMLWVVLVARALELVVVSCGSKFLMS